MKEQKCASHTPAISNQAAQLLYRAQLRSCFLFHKALSYEIKNASIPKTGTKAVCSALPPRLPYSYDLSTVCYGIPPRGFHHKLRKWKGCFPYRFAPSTGSLKISTAAVFFKRLSSIYSSLIITLLSQCCKDFLQNMSVYSDRSLLRNHQMLRPNKTAAIKPSIRFSFQYPLFPRTISPAGSKV